MSNTTNLFAVKNLYGYEEILAPPKNLPGNMITTYITDSESVASQAAYLGWDKTICTLKFAGASDPLRRRQAVAYINSFPHEFIDDYLDYGFIFVCDSNVKVLYKAYKDFVSSCLPDHCLFVTSGYYSGARNTIPAETWASIHNNPRWQYNHQAISTRVDQYISILQSLDIKIDDAGIASAKYIGWNPHHPAYTFLSRRLYEEYLTHLQGNIILTYLKAVYPDLIYDCVQRDYTEGVTTQHKFLA